MRADPVGPALRAASLFPRVVKDKQRPANTLAAKKLGEDRKGCGGGGGGFSSDEILMVLTLILESVLLIQIRCSRRPPPPNSTAHFFLVQRCPPSATFDQPCARGSFGLDRAPAVSRGGSDAE